MAIAFELWGQRGYPHADIVGESHYYAAIRAVLGRNVNEDGTEVFETAVLTPEPGNRYDRNAVGVWIRGNQVGYLPREEAARYAPTLTRLTERGWEPQVNARVWGADWDGFRGSVRLDLAEPHLIVPANLPPADQHRELPYGNAIQVTGEEKHLADLTPYLRPEGECWVHATLHEITEQTARTTKALVEVRLDGARVGQLSPKMSGDLLPAIHHLAEQGVTTLVRAIVKGNRIKAEVVLYCARAHELPESWLGARAEVVVVPSAHSPIPPPPTGVRFTVPPEWPSPPDGWTPPPGWQPDPAWKPAPDGWQWWVPVWA
ncbi:HIRAN domain-containing protein [Actinoplanes sp. LDG1-06]|uniref:HIRAN domain-containing protein n=1 Tax=Paractinoplanes ovalisporus TaxID=2810368 RepID=A0ABS2APA5_9ACTN|nr:HIRAN domain-containing protein [Actinoplanes ovalisporus]MBM2621049.1 HIRAN domain-containing protein [Actinoplanes ovalisporus]